MKLIAYQELLAAPWKNGGGVTRELACYPEHASFDDFAWRVSIADVNQSGPFSVFPGIDRIITLLEGDGMQLQFAHGGTHALTQALMPYRFRGEDHLDAQLVGSPSRDFNLMLRRGDAYGEVEIHRKSGTIRGAVDTDQTTLLLFSVAGSWCATVVQDGACAAPALQQGDTLLLENANGEIAVAPVDADHARCALLCVRITLLPQQK